VHHAERIGLLKTDVVREIKAEMAEIDQELARLRNTFHDGSSLFQKLKRPGATYLGLPGAREKMRPETIEQLEICAKYDGYIERELAQIKRIEKLENLSIPDSLNYNDIKALRYESIEKLCKIRPETVGQASRISGVNPADVMILCAWIEKRSPSDN